MLLHGVCLSERHNHARELARDADLSQWDAFVIMSGDGLLFEVKKETCTQQDVDMHTLQKRIPTSFPVNQNEALINSKCWMPKLISDLEKLSFEDITGRTVRYYNKTLLISTTFDDVIKHNKSITASDSHFSAEWFYRFEIVTFVIHPSSRTSKNSILNILYYYNVLIPQLHISILLHAS